MGRHHEQGSSKLSAVLMQLPGRGQESRHLPRHLDRLDYRSCTFRKYPRPFRHQQTTTDLMLMDSPKSRHGRGVPHLSTADLLLPRFDQMRQQRLSPKSPHLEIQIRECSELELIQREQQILEDSSAYVHHF